MATIGFAARDPDKGGHKSVAPVWGVRPSREQLAAKFVPRRMGWRQDIPMSDAPVAERASMR